MNQTNQIDQMLAERAVNNQSVGSRLRLSGEDSRLITQHDVILGQTQPEPPPGCQTLGWLFVNATGAPAPRDPELRLPPLSRARQAEVEVKVEQSPDFLFSAST